VSNKLLSIIFIISILGVIVFIFTRGEKFELPQGETVPFLEEEIISTEEGVGTGKSIMSDKETDVTQPYMSKSSREIFSTGEVKHSIPLDEILSGGPPKDGIPSIDNPKFINVKSADKQLEEDSPGLGITVGDTSRFYPYQILVWHEIVNDTIEGKPVLVTYCPLCITGIAFSREFDGKSIEFGVSGRLWKSNLLMYDRTNNIEDESLWSQVLGEAVLGQKTGEKLEVIPSDAVMYGVWKKNHPNTEVLSRDTGIARTYGDRDPYGGYYTDDTVSFGATFNDSRLHQKEFVLGIEIDGVFKAYHVGAIKEGTITDTFAGQTITIEKDSFDSVRMFIGSEKQPLPYVGGFWFSWLAVHPDTELFK